MNSIFGSKLLRIDLNVFISSTFCHGIMPSSINLKSVLIIILQYEEGKCNRNSGIS